YLKLLESTKKTPPGPRPPLQCPQLRRPLSTRKVDKSAKDPIRKTLWKQEEDEEKENIPPQIPLSPPVEHIVVELPTIGPVETPITVTFSVTLQ
ncbi:E4 protein, partial [Tursiops truncatus papillomavirus 8]